MLRQLRAALFVHVTLHTLTAPPHFSFPTGTKPSGDLDKSQMNEQDNRDARRYRVTRTADSIDSTCAEEDASTSRSYTLFSETISDPTDDSDGEEQNLTMMRRRRPIIKWNATCLQAFLYPLALAIYLLVGALIFMAIESEHEKDVKENSEINRRQLFDDITNKYNLSREQVEEIFEIFTKMCKNKALQNSSVNNWDFLPSVMFVTSVITTIGKIKTCSQPLVHACD